MKILLTNDDGILAPGLVALHGALRAFGDVSVVAPESGQSASGHSITVAHPLIISRVSVQEKFQGWSVDGRPADCVKVACRELLDARPDMVVSGVNSGANVGVNVIYSGTVAAAVEGAFFNIPSIAFSQEMGEEVDFDQSAELAALVLRRLVELDALRPGLLLNVNFPRIRPDRRRPLGLRVVPQSTATLQDRLIRREDPRGRIYFWMDNPERPTLEDEPTDASALEAGYITVTPLMFNLTNRADIADVAGWDWGEFAGPAE